MKHTALVALALCTAAGSVLAQEQHHHAHPLAPRHHLPPQEAGMQRLGKRQLLGGVLGGLTGAGNAHTTPATGAAAQTSEAPAAAGAAGTQTTAGHAGAATSGAAQVPAQDTATQPATQPMSTAPALVGTSQTVPVAAESSSSNAATVPLAATSASAVVSSSASKTVALASSAPTRSVTQTVSGSATQSVSSGTSSTASSSSASAASNKKDSSASSGGISKAVLIPIIVVASVVALIGAIWTIVRKTKFSPSRRFEAKLAPIDYAPDAVDVDDRDAILAHARNGSAHSHAGGQPPHGAYGGAHYAASLARSDSGKTSVPGGMPMSESMHNVATIPYNGPAYVQAPYYGAPAFGSAQPGYPHEQAYAYSDLARAGSFSSNPYGDTRAASPALHRMPTARSGMASPAPPAGPAVYDYAAQARAASRGGMRY